MLVLCLWTCECSYSYAVFVVFAKFCMSALLGTSLHLTEFTKILVSAVILHVCGVLGVSAEFFLFADSILYVSAVLLEFAEFLVSVPCLC